VSLLPMPALAQIPRPRVVVGAASRARPAPGCSSARSAHLLTLVEANQTFTACRSATRSLPAARHQGAAIRLQEGRGRQDHHGVEPAMRSIRRAHGDARQRRHDCVRPLVTGARGRSALGQRAGLHGNSASACRTPEGRRQTLRCAVSSKPSGCACRHRGAGQSVPLPARPYERAT